MIGEAGPEAIIPLDKMDGLGSNTIVVDNTLELDGKVIYENQKEYEERNTYRKTGSTTGGGHARG